LHTNIWHANEILNGMQVKIAAGCGNRNDWRSSL